MILVEISPVEWEVLRPINRNQITGWKCIFSFYCKMPMSACILQYLCWIFYNGEYPLYKCIFFHDIWYHHSIGYNLVFHSTVNVGDFGYHYNLSNHFIGLTYCFEVCIHFIGMSRFTSKYPFFSTIL